MCGYVWMCEWVWVWVWACWHNLTRCCEILAAVEPLLCCLMNQEGLKWCRGEASPGRQCPAAAAALPLQGPLCDAGAGAWRQPVLLV